MPLVINRSTEAALSTLFNTDFIRSLTQYLGMDPDTPSEDMPLSVTELLGEAISSCEQEQWRFILPKTATLLLPVEALCYPDGMLFLPLGTATTITVTHRNLSDVVTPFTAFTQYAGEPTRLWSDTWIDLTNNCYNSPYPVTITYSPGYTSYADVPKSTVRALKLLVAHSFEYRGADVPVPKAYEHNRNLGWFNSERANKYIIDDWSKVSPR